MKHQNNSLSFAYFLINLYKYRYYFIKQNVLLPWAIKEEAIAKNWHRPPIAKFSHERYATYVLARDGIAAEIL